MHVPTHTHVTHFALKHIFRASVTRDSGFISLDNHYPWIFHNYPYNSMDYPLSTLIIHLPCVQLRRPSVDQLIRPVHDWVHYLPFHELGSPLPVVDNLLDLFDTVFSWGNVHESVLTFGLDRRLPQLSFPLFFISNGYLKFSWYPSFLSRLKNVRPHGYSRL